MYLKLIRGLSSNVRNFILFLLLHHRKSLKLLKLRFPRDVSLFFNSFPPYSSALFDFEQLIRPSTLAYIQYFIYTAKYNSVPITQLCRIHIFAFYPILRARTVL